ncbi:hypothetical protein HGRIS_011673 [Hohenbuehelia grisea]|uniref:Uncharacterized protein n=1 Tax=Hohenbuehelia grisea TaxID=104357 RepID=A0ABR3JXW9_9AGAR
MSHRILKDTRHTHDLWNDLESFLHVILYEALRHCEHDQGGDTGTFIFETFDEERQRPDEEWVGGDRKQLMIMEWPAALKFTFTASPLNEWLFQTMSMFMEAIISQIQHKYGAKVKDTEATPSGSYTAIIAKVKSHFALQKIWDHLRDALQDSES